MLTIKAHKIRLNPTPEQERYFWQAAGVARFAFNWGLAEYNRRKEAGEPVKIVGKGETLKAQFTAIKAEIRAARLDVARAIEQTEVSRNGHKVGV